MEKHPTYLILLTDNWLLRQLTINQRICLNVHLYFILRWRQHRFLWSQGGREEADSSSEQDSSLGARPRRRGAVKVEQDEESIDWVSPVKKSSSSASAPYSAPESGFRCAPCGFTTEDQATFLEHIIQHRRGATEGGGQQCLQCGACFTSTSSLSRHHFITHKVRNAFTDSQQSPSMPAPSIGNNKNHDDKSSLDDSAPASPSSQGTEEEGKLACKVCRKKFEKASDLNTHFRTHGMAFIIARNAGKTTWDTRFVGREQCG